MSKLYNALNVANDTELMELVESLDLSDKQYVDFMSALNEDLTEDGYRLVLENLTKSWMNGSYEKLQEQYKKPSQKRTKKVEDWDYYYGDEYLGSAKIERDLKTGKGKTISMKDKDGKDEKIEEDTVYDHSWYEVKGGKYPKRTKEGVIVKEDVSKINPKVLDELYEIISDQMGNMYLANYDEVDFDNLLDSVDDFGNDIDGYNPALKKDYALALKAKWEKDNKDYENDYILDLSAGIFESAKDVADESIQDTDWNSFVQKIGKRYLIGNTLCWQHLKTYIKVTKNGNVYIMQHNDILRRAFTDCKTFDDIYDKLYTKNLLPSVTERHITEAKNIEDEPDTIAEEPVKEEKPVSTADPEIAKFIDQTEKVVDNTMNPEILQGLAASVEAKIPLATDVEQMNKLGELKAKIETKLNAASTAPVVEGYNPEDEDIFEIGDQVSFKWNLEGDTDANLTGTVKEVQILGGNRYYNIASYNTEKERVENFYRVDPISNEMKKVNEPEDVAEEELDETASCGATCCGSVASFGKRFGKTAKRKNKKKLPEAIDTKLFKESIYTDTPAETVLEGHNLKYFMNEGKWYLSYDNALVKTYDKDVMIESIDEIVDGEEPSCGLLEGYSCYEMNVLMETIDTITSEDDTGEDMKGIHLGDMMSNNQALFATSKITDLDAYEKSDEYNAATPEQKIEKDRINQEVEKEMGNEMQLIDPKSQEMKNVKLLGTKKLNNGDAIAQVQDVNSNEVENVTTPSLKKKA